MTVANKPVRELVTAFHGGAQDFSNLGGKGASLCRLVSQGHRVPPGFVVTTHAFDATVASLGLNAAWNQLSAAFERGALDEVAAQELRGGFSHGRLPAAVWEPVLALVDRLALWANNPDGLIVRSSSTGEDSAAHSFAGMFESLTLQEPTQLERKIMEVWSSVFLARAMSYLKIVGIKRVLPMAAVVQRFLQAERSGVMFTTYPEARKRLLIEHVAGGCEKLVKGEVTPEQLWVEDRGAAREASVEPGSLASRHVRELLRLAHTLEAELGGPQDVEWVIYQDEVHLVQSRPITTQAPVGGSSARQRVKSDTPPLLRGTAASGGCGAGEVLLAFNIDQALTLKRGQVLVTPMTNPDMVVAMRNAAAIVTDVGGMICHAAIVSRELGVPCVVGTTVATSALEAGARVTVDGGQGTVYRGDAEIETTSASPVSWDDLWAAWGSSDVRGGVALAPCLDALRAISPGIDSAAIRVDLDLRCTAEGLWCDLEDLGLDARAEQLRAYLAQLRGVATARNLARLYVAPWPVLGDGLTQAVEQAGAPLVMLGASPEHEPEVTPLGFALLRPEAAAARAVDTMAEARAAALDTLRFFGHAPAKCVGPMPAPRARRAWWDALPEYGRFHREHDTIAARGEYEWLQIRPELVISTLLKSLVQPGFELVPRVLGFADLPPMHTKWIQCRYHFRSDTFTRVWQAIVRGTWDPAFMANLMARIRRSYDQLAEVLALFPNAEQARETAPRQMVALMTSWWPRWTEFFALCWFVQAQGDDILYPFIEQTVADNLSRIAAPPSAKAWPSAMDLVAPTTPVMSGEYMADVGRLHDLLARAGLVSVPAALAALGSGSEPRLAQQLELHLERWHWMRDRDLLFEPWDTPARVIETALKTEPHAPADYAGNLQRQRVALGLHADLARNCGRSDGLAHAVRFLHDLNTERENHHVLWLKHSYPLRTLLLELERRLLAANDLRAGDIFFFTLPELLEVCLGLPSPLSPELVSRVHNRRRGYRHEARLELSTDIAREDDYY